MIIKYYSVKFFDLFIKRERPQIQNFWWGTAITPVD